MIANTQIRTEIALQVSVEKINFEVNKFMEKEELKKILKETKDTLFLVVRRSSYITLSDNSTLNVGLYAVERLLCCNQEDLDSIISNFSHILARDDLALVTCNEIRAYEYMAQRNREICDMICEQCAPESAIFKKCYNFESEICETSLNKAKLAEIRNKGE